MTASQKRRRRPGRCWLHLPRTLSSIPGLRGRLPAPPLGAFPQGATLFELGEGPPLEEKTSAACGVGPDSIADALAVGCPVSPFFASTAWLGVLPGEERAHPARPALAFWALSGPNVCVGCLGADAVAVQAPESPRPRASPSRLPIQKTSR